MNLRKLMLLLSCFVTFSAMAKDQFTALEQQQISIETPGLFSRSNAFSIDFTVLNANEYCFPLPVGKANAVGNGDIEIETKKGDAVKAMFKGTVRLSRYNASYGNVVVIRHENGLETVYAFNAQNLVDVGQRVDAGQTIAIVGEHNNRTMCLFSIMINGGRINPETLIDIKSHRLRKQIVICRKQGNHVDLSVSKADKEDEKSSRYSSQHSRMKDSKADKEDDKSRKSSSEKSTEDVFAHGNVYRLNLSTLSKDEWSYPLPGSHVISPFGGARGHSGVDIKTKPNDEILATFDGVVTKSGPYFGYGNCIRIKHDNGLETLYSHQSRNFVKVGDRVKAGQVIGLTGRTGRATTEHLHFEVFFQGKRMNPLVIFDHPHHCLQNVTLVCMKLGKSVTIRTEKN
jgi:murein DD-endopeptidase MepM/ murein hydrolase activator NlpD